MLSTLPTLSTPPAAPAQATPASPAAPGAGEESRAFARQLQAAQDQDRSSDTPKRASGLPHPTARHAAPASGGKARAEVAETADTGTPPASTAAAPAAVSTEATVEPETASAAEPAVSEANPQDLSALLAHLRGHSPATDAAPGLRGATVATAEQASAEGLLRGGRAQRTAAPSEAVDTDARSTERPAILPGNPSGTPSGTQARDAAQDAAAAQFKDRLASDQVQATTQEVSSPTAAASQLPDTSTFTAALAHAAAPMAAAPAGTAQAGSATSSAQAQLPAPLGSPEFAPQLGAQISTFVRDGVQHAQLHLNPAEMGPVTVQIQLDGQAAQVSLLADQAMTRQALEQAMPQLAGSLREAGLTLTGGGVFQQPRQTGGEPGSSEGRSSRGRVGTRAAGALDSTTEAAQRGAASPRRRGVVDLVA